MQFTVLASGSSGNASLLEVDISGVLLDAGLGPRKIGTRLACFGRSWEQVRAVVLSHTHGDHWNNRTFAQLLRRRIPLYCHQAHTDELRIWSQEFAKLRTHGLVREYEADLETEIVPGLRCRPLRVSHDSGATFGFRFHAWDEASEQTLALAYLADLGCWTSHLASAVANVHVLALEFNHDVEMEYESGRSPYLVARVLGDLGHLSNVQAAELLREVIRLSDQDRLQHVVQLHLSRECNSPDVAAEAAREVLRRRAPGVRLHTAAQHRPGPCLSVSPSPCRPVSMAESALPWCSAPGWEQQWLPGWES
jgi:phosphoribosyl 1,2-cyclic phosphodiesterase